MAREAGKALLWGGLIGLLLAMFGRKKEDDDDRDPEGGDDPKPGGDLEIDGPRDSRIRNLLNDSPPEKRKRDRKDAWAVVLHQMGFQRGDDPMRYRKVTAHYIITPNGTIAQLHPINSRLNAAHGFNEGGISIELAGNFPSESKSTDPGDFWRPEKMGMDQVTPAQIEAGRYLLRRLKSVILPSQDKMLTHVLAHRQSSFTRANDPGPDAWWGLGEYGIKILDLSDGGSDFSVGTGLSIPEKWRTAYHEA
jgi:hypothetical protein